MYSTSDEYKNQINETRLHTIRGKVYPKNWTYDFDITGNLCGEISKYSQCTDNAESFGIGAVYQSELNFSLKTSLGFSADIYNAKVELQFGLVLESGETEWIPLGVYYIKDIEKSGKILKVKALDQMSELDIPTGLIKGQTYTFKTSMQKITENTGVEFAQTFEEIDSLVSIGLWQYYGFGEPATYRDILRSMAQLFGGFAYINRDGKIEFKRLDNTNPVAEIPAKRRHSLILSERPFEFGKLQYKSGNGTVTTYTYQGNGATVYFENSGFIYDEGTLNQLEEIAESLKNVNYYPGTIEYSGDPSLDIGDYIRITGGDSNNELMLIGSDNWIFRGVQTLISPNTDNGTSSGGGYSGGTSGSVSSGGSDMEYLKCDSSIGFGDTGLTAVSIDFKVTSYSTFAELSGDIIFDSETKQNAEIKYFLDDSPEEFTVKQIVDGYTAVHLNHIFTAGKGEHNIKAEIKGLVYAEQVLAYLKGQDIKLVETKPTTADDYVYIIENDTVKLIFYKGTEKRIQIPSEIEGKPVTEIESTCFTYSDVKYAIIPETVKKIY